jgi:hypothetical protein
MDEQGLTDRHGQRRCFLSAHQALAGARCGVAAFVDAIARLGAVAVDGARGALAPVPSWDACAARLGLAGEALRAGDGLAEPVLGAALPFGAARRVAGLDASARPLREAAGVEEFLAHLFTLAFGW